MDKNETGQKGELVASRCLERKNYKIITMNYRSRYGEIDIIASDTQYIVFVEVKTRSSHTIAAPREWVGIAKQRKIISTAMIYLSENKTTLQPRFDVIEVIMDDDRGGHDRVIHIQNAFETEGVV